MGKFTTTYTQKYNNNNRTKNKISNFDYNGIKVEEIRLMFM